MSMPIKIFNFDKLEHLRINKNKIELVVIEDLFWAVL